MHSTVTNDCVCVQISCSTINLLLHGSIVAARDDSDRALTKLLSHSTALVSYKKPIFIDVFASKLQWTQRKRSSAPDGPHQEHHMEHHGSHIESSDLHMKSS